MLGARAAMGSDRENVYLVLVLKGERSAQTRRRGGFKVCFSDIPRSRSFTKRPLSNLPAHIPSQNKAGASRALRLQISGVTGPVVNPAVGECLDKLGRIP